MAISIKEVPLNTRLATKSARSVKPETIRAKARIVIKEYDDSRFIVGLKRGNTFVKKFTVTRKQDGQTLTIAAVEENVRAMMMNGDFDRALIHDFHRKKPGTGEMPKRGRGRPRKNPA